MQRSISTRQGDRHREGPLVHLGAGTEQPMVPGAIHQTDVVGLDRHIGGILGHLYREPPGCGICPSILSMFHRGDVRAAHETAGRQGAGMIEKRLRGLHGLGSPVVDHTHLMAQPPHLFPAMGDHKAGAGELLQKPRQFPLNLPPQVGVQGRKGFIQQQHLGLSSQNPGQGHPLLLSP